MTASHDNTRLLLVGGGEMTPELNTLIDKHSIRHRMVMPGRIPHERIAGVYALIDILAYPRYSIRMTELVTPSNPWKPWPWKKPWWPVTWAATRN